MTPVIVCDFDGTLAVEDVGDAICERFADPAWRAIDEAWLRGELTLPEAQRRMWALVRAGADAIVAYAQEVGAFRAGADVLFEHAARETIRLVLASGGFDLYIDALLGDRRRHVEAIYCNALRAHPAGAEVAFPHRDLARDPYAIDKGLVLRRYLAAGQRVAFCGDGSSDVGALRTVQEAAAAGGTVEVFAVPGRRFAERCQAEGVMYHPLHDFAEVVAAMVHRA